MLVLVLVLTLMRVTASVDSRTITAWPVRSWPSRIHALIVTRPVMLEREGLWKHSVPICLRAISRRSKRGGASVVMIPRLQPSTAS